MNRSLLLLQSKTLSPFIEDPHMATPGLASTRFVRTDLLHIVQENRSKHVEEFEDAHRKYKDALLVRLKEIAGDIGTLVGRVAKGDDIVKLRDELELRPNLIQPQSYAEQYDRAIRRISLSVDQFVTLTESEFEQLVLDNWNWKGDFMRTTSVYK